MTASDGSAHDWFGVSVAATDEVIVVGSWLGDSSTLTGSGWSDGPGAAYVFSASSGRQLARLDSPNAQAGGGFGWEVEIVGDMILVAAHKEMVSTTANAGRVYVFNKPSGGWADTSTPAATLTPGTTSAPGSVEFGNGLSVSGDGNTIVVGAPKWEHSGDSSDVSGLDRDGAVFVFTKPATGWANADTDASGVARLYAGSRVRRYDALGNQVHISGDGNTIAASAPFGWGGEGYVYMFTKPMTGWASTATTDTPVRLTVTNRFDNQRLGSKGVALSGDGSTLVVDGSGAWSKGTSGDSQIPDGYIGAAYVFVRPAGGWAEATETAKLTTFGHKYDQFGAGVAISASGDKIAVANADSRSSNYRGSAYVYTRPSGGWTDDTDGAGDNVRVLTTAAADDNPRQRYGFGGRGFAFIGEDKLVVGQPAQVWALYKKDTLSSLPAGGLYGANADHSNLANVPQGSAYLFILRKTPPPGPPPRTPPPPPPPEEPDEPQELPAPPVPEFDDVDEGSIHAENIKEVAALRITVGTTATTFSPDKAVTRGQMATFLARTWEASGQECPTTGSAYFDDVVASGSTHATGIDCMSALGVARGTTVSTFSPDKAVTRGQMATLLTRAWGAAGRTCPPSGSSAFDDVASGLTHAFGIDCMSALGVARGTTATTFSPSQPVTRAQMATFLARFHQALTGS